MRLEYNDLLIRTACPSDLLDVTKRADILRNIKLRNTKLYLLEDKDTYVGCCIANRIQDSDVWSLRYKVQQDYRAQSINAAVYCLLQCKKTEAVECRLQDDDRKQLFIELEHAVCLSNTDTTLLAYFATT